MSATTATTSIKSTAIINSNKSLNETNSRYSYESSELVVDGKWFKDSLGRTLMLRGVNLSGSCKLPIEMTSHDSTGFFENARHVSFIGRPFPLDEANLHFQRLKAWGFTFLRLLITWEAIEHEGPGLYDEPYFDYIVQLLRKAQTFGFKCFIDPHQDCWSRFSGGSGAPAWTLELVGFDIQKFKVTEAALVQNTYSDPLNFPKMIWPTNYFKLATCTMFTLFFGGNDFAPRCLVNINSDVMIILNPAEYQLYKDGKFSIPSNQLVPIQDYLQSHYINSVTALISYIKQKDSSLLDNVICGYDTFNEPSGGFLGWQDITKFSIHQELKNGSTPTPLQSMLSGEGVPQQVEIWEFGSFGPSKKKTTLVNSEGVRCWREGYKCIWLEHGVYDKETKTALRPNYFNSIPGKSQELDWISTHWKAFVRKYVSSIRNLHSNAIIFLEPPVNELPPLWEPELGDPTDRICYTPHWYDGITLLNKSFSTWWTIDYIGYKRGLYSNILGALNFGYKGIKNAFSKQLGLIRKEGLGYIGDSPCLIGEIGIPFDLDKKYAYRTGDYKSQLLAMNANMSALENNLLNFTLWNYCSDNNHKWGDNWNGEDFSLYSSDTRDSKRMKRERTIDTTFTRDSGVGESLRSKDSSDLLLSEIPSKLKEEKNKIHCRSSSAPLLTIDDLNFGARALNAFVRPYPIRTDGEPISISFEFDTNKKYFRYKFKGGLVSRGRKIGEGTEIFVPSIHYGLPSILARNIEDSAFFAYPLTEPVSRKELEEAKIYFEVKVSDGSWTFDSNSQVLHYFHSSGEKADQHEIVVSVFSAKASTGTDSSSTCIIL